MHAIIFDGEGGTRKACRFAERVGGIERRKSLP